jgi:CRP-like cAMP-binding protein
VDDSLVMCRFTSERGFGLFVNDTYAGLVAAVTGWDTDDLRRVSRLATVYSWDLNAAVTGKPRVNVNTATAVELLRLAASRLHGTASALEEALAHDVPTRLSRRLCELARRHGVPDGAGVLLPLPLTQEDLGRMVGASRESVNRSLAALSSRGLVRTEGRRYVIPDLEALARASAHEEATA